MTVDVRLPEHLTERVLEIVDGALPPRLQLRHALQRAAVEVEPCVDEFLAEIWRQRARRVEFQIGLPSIDRHLPDGGGHGLKVAGLGDDHTGGTLDASLIHPG